MKKFYKWLIILIPVIIFLFFLLIVALIPNNAAKEKNEKKKDYVTKDSRVTFNAYESYKKEDKGEYDLYLNKDNKQIVGVFTYNLNEYEEKTAKEVLDHQIENFSKTRKDMKLWKKENTIDMEDKTITKVEYTGKTEKSSDCVYVFSTISFKADPNYVVYIDEVIIQNKYEDNIKEMIDILKSAKLN